MLDFNNVTGTCLQILSAIHHSTTRLAHDNQFLTCGSPLHVVCKIFALQNSMRRRQTFPFSCENKKYSLGEVSYYLQIVGTFHSPVLPSQDTQITSHQIFAKVSKFPICQFSGNPRNTAFRTHCRNLKNAVIAFRFLSFLGSFNKMENLISN